VKAPESVFMAPVGTGQEFSNMIFDTELQSKNTYWLTHSQHVTCLGNKSNNESLFNYIFNT
jgi:hypothetical protein